MIKHEEKKSEQVLEDGQQFQQQSCRVTYQFGKTEQILTNQSAVLNSSKKSQYLSCPPHLDIDIVGSALLHVILRVQSSILYQPQNLNLTTSTLSLLSVLESSPKNIFRYSINQQIITISIETWSFFSQENSMACHLTIRPLPLINVTIRPSILSIAVLLPISKLTDIPLRCRAMLVEVATFACPIEIVIFPLSLVLIVLSSLFALALRHIVDKLSLEIAHVLKGILPFSVFEIVLVHAMKNHSIRIYFISQSLLHTPLPPSLIYPVSFATVILTIAVSFIFVPLSSVVTSLFVNHHSIAITLILTPLTQVVKTLVVQHDSLAVFYFYVFIAQKDSVIELRVKLFVDLYFRQRYLIQNFLNVWVLKKEYLLEQGLCIYFSTSPYQTIRRSGCSPILQHYKLPIGLQDKQNNSQYTIIAFEYWTNS